MTMNTQNKYILARQNLIYQTMFIGNAPAPISLILMFESFGFAYSLKRMFMNVKNQFKNLFDKAGFIFRPLIQASIASVSNIVFFITQQGAWQIAQKYLR